MNPDNIRRRINATTGAGRRIARSRSPVGNQSRAMRAANTFMTNRPTQKMRTVNRRKSLGGAGG